MLPNLVEYHRPATMNAALRLLARRSVRTVPLAGGTALVPSSDESVQAVVDLGALKLAGITWRMGEARIGPMTTLQMLAADATAREFANGLLAEAAHDSATRNIRNVATVGGTIVTGESTSELLLALSVLDARLTVRVRRSRTLTLKDFLTAPYEYLVGGIITRVVFPILKIPHGAALARVARTPKDRAIVNAAAFTAAVGEDCKQVRLALGGVAPSVIRAGAVESVLQGRTWDDSVAERTAQHFAASLATPADCRGSSEYRREMAAVVAERALKQAWANAQQR